MKRRIKYLNSHGCWADPFKHLQLEREGRTFLDNQPSKNFSIIFFCKVIAIRRAWPGHHMFIFLTIFDLFGFSRSNLRQKLTNFLINQTSSTGSKLEKDHGADRRIPVGVQQRRNGAHGPAPEADRAHLRVR